MFNDVYILCLQLIHIQATPDLSRRLEEHNVTEKSGFTLVHLNLNH